jgi:PKD repeat protein
MRARSVVTAATLCVAVMLAGCTVHKTEAPPLSGPSELALSLSMTATPDSIAEDGGSQSAVKIVARGPDGRGLASLPLRVDMSVNNVPQDFGTLSARSVVTGSDGSATVMYTAPRQTQGANTGTCNSLPGMCVTIVATATGSNFQAANPQIVTIRLVPPGVILPPAGSPEAKFTVTPTPPSVAVPLIFDASSSTAGQNSGEITSYVWNFGDGSAEASGRTATHTFTTGGTFSVTLTVTNDRGLSASTTQAIAVGTSDPFSGDWTFSPTAPVVAQSILFNASGVQSSAGHDVTQFSWDFGDGATASGAVTSHAYSLPGTYNVVLSVADDLGRRKVFGPKPVTVGNGSPVAIIAPPSVIGKTVNFDASGSTAAPGATIVSYDWNFGDGATSQAGPTTSHTYATAQPFTVRLTVTDSSGRTGVASVTVTTTP